MLCLFTIQYTMRDQFNPQPQEERNVIGFIYLMPLNVLILATGVQCYILSGHLIKSGAKVLRTLPLIAN